MNKVDVPVNPSQPVAYLIISAYLIGFKRGTGDKQSFNLSIFQSFKNGTVSEIAASAASQPPPKKTLLLLDVFFP